MASYPYRTVVDAAAISRALVDATIVFAELGITPTDEQTTQMETVIGQTSALVDRFLDRVLAEEDVTDYFRAPRGDVLRLSRYPVAEILEVIEDGDALTPDGWEINDVTGELWRTSGGDRSCWVDCGTIMVSYVGGYILPDDLPADIQRAAIDDIKAKFMAGPRDPALRSQTTERVGSATYSVAGGDSFGKSGLLAQVEGALKPHRREST